MSAVPEPFLVGPIAVVSHWSLRVSLSGTFLQALPELVTPLKGHTTPRLPAPPSSARTGYTTEGAHHTSSSGTSKLCQNWLRHWRGTPQIRLPAPPNSPRTGYATEGARTFISAQLSTDTVSVLRKVWVLIRLWKQRSVQACTQTWGASVPGRRFFFRLDSNDLGIIFCWRKQRGQLWRKRLT